MERLSHIIEKKGTINCSFLIYIKHIFPLSFASFPPLSIPFSFELHALHEDLFSSTECFSLFFIYSTSVSLVSFPALCHQALLLTTMFIESLPRVYFSTLFQAPDFCASFHAQLLLYSSNLASVSLLSLPISPPLYSNPFSAYRLRINH